VISISQPPVPRPHHHSPNDAQITYVLLTYLFTFLEDGPASSKPECRRDLLTQPQIKSFEQSCINNRSATSDAAACRILTRWDVFLRDRVLYQQQQAPLVAGISIAHL
jgi:hypothetical protein